jgi:hypothetical protein
MMAAIAALVRVTQPFSGDLLLRQEVIRFFGIKLNWSAAARLACKPAYLMNVFWGATLAVIGSPRSSTFALPVDSVMTFAHHSPFHGQGPMSDVTRIPVRSQRSAAPAD